MPYTVDEFTHLLTVKNVADFSKRMQEMTDELKEWSAKIDADKLIDDVGELPPELHYWFTLGASEAYMYLFNQIGLNGDEIARYLREKYDDAKSNHFYGDGSDWTAAIMFSIENFANFLNIKLED